MRRVMVVLQEKLQAFIDKRLNATRTGEHVAKQGRWMLQLPFRSGFQRRKKCGLGSFYHEGVEYRTTGGVVCTMEELNIG